MDRNTYLFSLQKKTHYVCKILCLGRKGKKGKGVSLCCIKKKEHHQYARCPKPKPMFSFIVNQRNTTSTQGVQTVLKTHT